MYIGGMNYGYSYGYMSALPVLVIIGIISGLVIGILACVMVLPVKKRDGLSPFFKKVHDFIQFKYLWIESIIKVLYVITTCVGTMVGILLLFGPMFLCGLLIIIISVVGNRLFYEWLLVFILILRNTKQINEKIPGKEQTLGGTLNGSGEFSRNYVQADSAYDPYYGAAPQPEPEPEPKWRYCSQCGTRYDANKGGCPNGCE